MNPEKYRMATQLEVENVCTADEFTGKKVVDREGIMYGKVKHIHINANTLVVSGVTVHQGFHKDYYLPTEYIDRFTAKSLLLSHPPIRTDIPVVDIDGNKLGKVKRLVKNSETNELDSIEVSSALHSRLISKSDIWGIGERVTLKLTKEQFKQLK